VKLVSKRRRRRKHKQQSSGNVRPRRLNWRSQTAELAIVLAGLGTAIFVGLTAGEGRDPSLTAKASVGLPASFDEGVADISSNLFSNGEASYNAKVPPNLDRSQRLQAIVDRVVRSAYIRGMPTDRLSVYLVDLNTQQFAEYRGQTLRYPASVVKIFWMVLLFDRVERGILPPEKLNFDLEECDSELCQMVQLSNNDAASVIVDEVTQTAPGDPFDTEDFDRWLHARQFVNRFFGNSGYEQLNIAQKNYPIYYLGQDLPQGRELLASGTEPEAVRNQMSAAHAARLMYEIANKRAISETASRQMLQLMKRDLTWDPWRDGYYHPIDGFFGGGLMEELRRSQVSLYSKVGLTTETRNEVALVRTVDGRANYILAVFGDDVAYGADEEIFPELSRIVFASLTGGNPERSP